MVFSDFLTTSERAERKLSDLFTLFRLGVPLLGALVVLTCLGVMRCWHWAARCGAYLAWAIIAIAVAYATGWASLLVGREAKPLTAPPARPGRPAAPPPRQVFALQTEPQAKEVLDRLAKTYGALKTYRDSAKGHVTSADDRGKETTFDVSSRMAFIRPDRLRIEYRGNQLMDTHQVVWKRGNDLKGWDNFGLGQPNSLVTALGGVAGGSWFIAHNVPHLLLGTKGVPPYLSELGGAKRLGDEKLGEMTCQHVEGRSGLWTVVIWVDVRCGLLRRLDLKQRFLRSTTLFEPVADEPVPDELLEFRPREQKTR